MIKLFTIADTISGWITTGLNYVTAFMLSLPWWVSALIVLGVAILLIIGLIYLFVKTWKVLLVLAILGGIGYLVYYLVVKDGGSATTTVASIANVLGALC